MDTTLSIPTEAILSAAKKQARPRRWPWQPKTVRDRLNDWGADLATLAVAQGEVLLDYVRQQSRPRRWPWQQRTVRDNLNARSAELAALAAERSAELAAAIAVRSAELAAPLTERRDALLAEAKRQSQPRRWPWQAKTARDKLSERSAKLAAQAATRSAELAAVAAARRDALLAEAKRQSQPRRWPWQAKTARDRLEAQRAAAQGAAAAQLALANEKLQLATQTGAQALAEAKRQSQPRRWPWQAKTVRDRLGERAVDLKASATDRVTLTNEKLQQAAKVGAGAAVAGAALAAAQARKAAEQAQALPDQVLPVIKDQASAAGAAVQHAVAAVPEVIGSAASSVGDSLKETAGSISKSVGKGRRGTSSAARAAVRAPVDAMSYRMKSGRKTVNHGVHLVTTALRWAIIGFIIGLLTSPASGKELRRQLRDAAVRIIDGVLQPN